jgi:hypothetical protein
LPGFIVAAVPVNRPKRKRTATVRMKSWHTGMAFSPYDGDLYVCQYAVRAP